MNRRMITDAMIAQLNNGENLRSLELETGPNGRMFRRARKNQARIKELERHQEALLQSQQQASLTKVKDVEDWIRIVQTRTRALDLLRKFKHNREVRAFLEEIGE